MPPFTDEENRAGRDLVTCPGHVAPEPHWKASQRLQTSLLASLPAASVFDTPTLETWLSRLLDLKFTAIKKKTQTNIKCIFKVVCCEIKKSRIKTMIGLHLLAANSSTNMKLSELENVLHDLAEQNSKKKFLIRLMKFKSCLMLYVRET